MKPIVTECRWCHAQVESFETGTDVRLGIRRIEWLAKGADVPIICRPKNKPRDHAGNYHEPVGGSALEELIEVTLAKGRHDEAA